MIGRRLDNEPLVILQVPDRGYHQFEQKIRNGGGSYLNNSNAVLPLDAGWHWREDYLRLTAGTLEQAWSERQLDRSEISRRCRNGSLFHDRRLADRIEHLATKPVLADSLQFIVPGGIPGKTSIELRYRWGR